MTVPLPLPADPALTALQAAWPDPARWPYRSRWLHDFEAQLRRHYPHATSRQLSLVARGAAPFPLRDGPGVP